MEIKDQLLSAAEGETLIGIRRETLRKWAWQRKIRSFKVGGALRFSRKDLLRLIVERPTK
jgi:excisionase family DNA binding protein